MLQKSLFPPISYLAAVKQPRRNITLGIANLKLVSFQINDIKNKHTPLLLPPVGGISEHEQQTTRLLPKNILLDQSKLLKLAEDSSPFQTFLVSKSALQNLMTEKSNVTNTTNLLPESLDPLGPNSLATTSANNYMSLLSSLQTAPSTSLNAVAVSDNEELNKYYSQKSSKVEKEVFDALNETETRFITAAGRGDVATVRNILATAYKEAFTQLYKPSRKLNVETGSSPFAVDPSLNDVDFLDQLHTDTIALVRHSPFLPINVNAQREKGGSALHFACMNGHTEMVGLLLRHGAEVHLAAANGSTALHWAAGNGHLQIVRLLLGEGADPLRATSTWCIDIFGRNSGQTPLQWAAASGHLACVRELHDYAPGCIGAVDEKGNTAIDLARKDLQLHVSSFIQETLEEEYVSVSLRVMEYSTTKTIYNTSH